LRRAIISASLVAPLRGAPAPMALGWINTTSLFFALDQPTFHFFADKFTHIFVGFFTP
jgi:hypothetical protein